MRYYGKRIDTFEPAVLQLMEYERIRETLDLDCISLRAFGFRADGERKKWFRPFADTETAVKTLREMMNIPIAVFRLCSVEQISELPEAFVLGPAKSGIAAPSVSEYYYSGDGRYLFVCRIKDKYEVFDPWGFSGLQMTCEEMISVIEYGESYCIYLDKACDDLFPVLHSDETMLLRRGLVYRQEMGEYEKESIEKACLKYADTQSGRIAVQCGILNMIQMLDKVFALAGKCGYRCVQAEYVRKKQQIFRMAETGEIRRLPEALSGIWRCLEYYEG